MTTSMFPIAPSEQDEFLSMAAKHFSELNPSFVPQDDWKEHYFATIMANPQYFLRWILCDEKRAGFILMGLEKHRFLPRKTGAIYDLYVSPEFRGRGVAQACGEAAIRELWTHSPSKIQIELANGQSSWAAFWKSLGFQKATERFVLGRGSREDRNCAADISALARLFRSARPGGQVRAARHGAV